MRQFRHLLSEPALSYHRMEEKETVFSGQCFRPLPALTPARSGCGGFPCSGKRPQAGPAGSLRRLPAPVQRGYTFGSSVKEQTAAVPCAKRNTAIRLSSTWHVLLRAAPSACIRRVCAAEKTGALQPKTAAARPSGSVQVISGSGSCTSGISSRSMMVSISSIFSHSAGVNRARMRSITARR